VQRFDLNNRHTSYYTVFVNITTGKALLEVSFSSHHINVAIEALQRAYLISNNGFLVVIAVIDHCRSIYTAKMVNSKASLQVCSIFSIILCSFVLITMITFPTMRKNKIFMEIVAMIAFSSIMANIPYAIGIFPANGTVLCQYQGFSILYFFPVSWMFTVALAYLLRGLAYTGRLRLLRHHVHIICWGLPFLLVLLRLTTNTYGVEPALEHSSTCTYGGKNIESGFLWEAICFCGLLLCCCFLMIFWFGEIQYLQKHQSTTATSLTFTIAKETLFWYPVLLVLCWLPYSMYIIGKGPHISTQHVSGAELTLRCLKNLCGGLTACMFFWKCKEARLRWWYFLAPFICPKTAAAAKDAAFARRSISAPRCPGADGDIDWEDEYEDEFTPTDEIMQTKITSARIDPAKLAAALEAQGALDAASGTMGASTTAFSTLHDGRPRPVSMAGIDSIIFKRSNEINVTRTPTTMSSASTNTATADNSNQSASENPTVPCTAEV
jgi:hypothetical protein